MKYESLAVLFGLLFFCNLFLILPLTIITIGLQEASNPLVNFFGITSLIDFICLVINGALFGVFFDLSKGASNDK